MTRRRDFSGDMDRFADDEILDLDDWTADRLLDGRVLPLDAPPGFSPVAELILAAKAPASSAELAREAQTVAASLAALQAVPIVLVPAGRSAQLTATRPVAAGVSLLARPAPKKLVAGLALGVVFLATAAAAAIATIPSNHADAGRSSSIAAPALGAGRGHVPGHVSTGTGAPAAAGVASTAPAGSPGPSGPATSGAATDPVASHAHVLAVTPAPGPSAPAAPPAIAPSAPAPSGGGGTPAGPTTSGPSASPACTRAGNSAQCHTAGSPPGLNGGTPATPPGAGKSNGNGSGSSGSGSSGSSGQGSSGSSGSSGSTATSGSSKGSGGSSSGGGNGGSTLSGVTSAGAGILTAAGTSNSTSGSSSEGSSSKAGSSDAGSSSGPGKGNGATHAGPKPDRSSSGKSNKSGQH